MTKYKNKVTKEYKSKLESVCAKLLTEAGLWFEYEPWEVKFITGYKSKIESYEKVGKEFKAQNRVYKVGYTPDFVGKGWIIETKGMKTPDFIIKWKLFRKYLEENDMQYTLFMPTNQKQIKSSIEIIKSIENETGKIRDDSGSFVY